MNPIQELARMFCNLFLSYSGNEKVSTERIEIFIKETIAMLDEDNLRLFFVFIRQNERTSPNDAQRMEEFVRERLKKC